MNAWFRSLAITAVAAYAPLATSATTTDVLQPHLYLSATFGAVTQAGALAVGARLATSHALHQASTGGADETQALQMPQLLSLDFQPGNVLSLDMLGTPVAGYRFAAPALDDALRIEGADAQASGGWLDQHWWQVGLGALAVGALAVSANSGGNDPTSSSANPVEDSSISHESGNGGVLCTDGSCVVPVP